jgi:peptide/nickel transport system permease protein
MKNQALSSPMQEFWGHFLRNRLAVAGFGIVIGLLIVALLASFLAPQDPTLQSLPDKRAKPGGKFILGADEFGRDILSRLIYGTRAALLVGTVSIAIALLLGMILGTTSGFFGGMVDNLIMRILDILLAFPYLLLAIAVVSAIGPGILNTTIAVGIWAIPGFARIIRASVITIKKADYIQGARAIGASNTRIIFSHILPNFISPVIVYSTLYMANAILIEAALSFLGLGVQPPTPSWGLMVSSGRDFLLSAPHIATLPGIAIMITVLGFNLLGDGLRDSLDPKLRNL